MLSPTLPPPQAHKRGLDVGKLHGSRTPAWKNLRGRSASRRKQYFEGPEDEGDELEDRPSGSEEEEEEEHEARLDGRLTRKEGRKKRR